MSIEHAYDFLLEHQRWYHEGFLYGIDFSFGLVRLLRVDVLSYFLRQYLFQFQGSVLKATTNVSSPIMTGRTRNSNLRPGLFSILAIIRTKEIHVLPLWYTCDEGSPSPAELEPCTLTGQK